ncbi:lipopolysaccharide transport periplasmic protein LptA [Rhodobacter sp. Har01]|uniref:lipopolysaccharide transport periplasmic protein LptA n=1 Tax=Rhodobacter sp. Har01 TaxID=2883999 RepID=UPI001D083E93|nr:lipopolysaccharide transport periplasmic protein LptA [Rhodobacter sp. Har01]MCB6178070.1 lipopolysaccharide transport periplasmic protein LptA [Rhodobacter sp. Har01]
MIGPLRIGLLVAALAAPALPAASQEAKVAFGGLTQDTSLPVEVEADTLSVNNADGTAVFSGNVLVGQGDMRLAAAKVTVEYGADGQSIQRLHATGGVTFANLTDAAEAREALYTIDSGVIVMTGDVLLTQGASALAGQKLTIQLKDGTGVMEGRVSTTFVPGGN